MDSAAKDAIREIIFQGEHVSASPPRELVEALELYESLLWLSTGSGLDPKEVAQFIAATIVTYRGAGRWVDKQELYIPTRNETVFYVRSAPWGCSVVRNAANQLLVVMDSRMVDAGDYAAQQEKARKEREKAEKASKTKSATAEPAVAVAG